MRCKARFKEKLLYVINICQYPRKLLLLPFNAINSHGKTCYAQFCEFLSCNWTINYTQ